MSHSKLPFGLFNFFFFLIKFFHCNPIIFSYLFLLSHIWAEVDNNQTIASSKKKNYVLKVDEKPKPINIDPNMNSPPTCSLKATTSVQLKKATTSDPPQLWTHAKSELATVQ